MTGRKFKALHLFDAPTVKFVGVAAGVLEAARAGAVPAIIRDLFFTKIGHLRDTLSSSRVSTLRAQGAGSTFYNRAAEVLTAKKGKLYVEKMHSVQIFVDRAEDVSTVWALRVIEVPFHPSQYGSPYP